MKPGELGEVSSTLEVIQLLSPANSEGPSWSTEELQFSLQRGSRAGKEETGNGSTSSRNDSKWKNASYSKRRRREGKWYVTRDN